MSLFRWEDIDHKLVSLRMIDLAEEMRAQIETDERRIKFENRDNLNSNTVPSLVLKMKQDRADEWAGRVYAIYCEVWQTQGQVKSAAFVRAVSARAIQPFLQTRVAAIAARFSKLTRATNLPFMLRDGHLQSLSRNMGRVGGRWRRQLEIEARECEQAEQRARLDSARSVLESPPAGSIELAATVRPPAEPTSPSLSPAQEGPLAEPQGASGIDMSTHLASSEERALIPNHLSGSKVEQFLEEFLAVKTLIKAEAEKIWNGCSKVHRMISVAANDEKRRVFSEQYDKWRDQLIELQEILIVGRLLPIIAKYQIFANEQKWLLQACDEVWRPVTAGYLDWLTFAVQGHVHGIGTGAIPEWAWQLCGAPRDVTSLDSPEKKASAHFRGLVDTLQRDLALYREGAIAKAFLARNTNESPIVASGIRGLELEPDHESVTIQADRGNKSRGGLPSAHSAPLSAFDATVGKLMVEARKSCPRKYLPRSEILKIARLLDDQNLPLRDNLERTAAQTVARHNKQNPKAAIKTWQTASNHPRFRGAVRKRFSRAEEKYKKATSSIADSSVGTPRTTI